MDNSCIFYTYFNDEEIQSPLYRRPIKFIKAFMDCMRRMGIEVRDIRHYKPVQNAIVWGAYKEDICIDHKFRKDLSDQQRKRGLNTVLIERGYVERTEYYSIGFTQYPRELNNDADFKNKNMPNDRSSILNTKLKPWQNSDEKKYVLVCGQTFNDANVDDVDYPNWLSETLSYLVKVSNKKIIYRKHPLEWKKNISIPEGVKVSVDRSIEQDLKIASSVVSYNSNSCVEAVIEGIPSFVFSKRSVAWDVTNHDLSEINNPKTFDREQWFNNLAYTQWNLKEIEEGLPFKHLGILT
tara:strand:- start:368 stop:1252 length:885 start_codon:yes stop_codon:yes gene_type:complete